MSYVSKSVKSERILTQSRRTVMMGQDVFPDVQFGLVHDPPSARTAAAEPERVSRTGHETGFRKRLQRGRPRVDMQRPIDDLGDPIGESRT